MRDLTCLSATQPEPGCPPRCSGASTAALIFAPSRPRLWYPHGRHGPRRAHRGAKSGLDLMPYWCHADAMDLTRYVESLREDLAVAAAAGGQDARDLAERLIAPLDAAVRLMLLDALSAAADEITRDLAPGSVELRLRNGEPGFVVTPAPTDEPAEPAWEPAAPPDADEGATARINLRLPEQLKAGIEQAAARRRMSVNAWLVRAAATAVANDDRRPRQRGGRPGETFTGWVQ